jgi:hypothetical protein
VVEVVGGEARVRFGAAAPVAVRAVVGVDGALLSPGRAVLAVRVDGEPSPIVIGVVEAPGVERIARRVDFGAAPERPDAERSAHVELSAEAARRPEVEADGQRVTVEAAEEIVLRCGEASLTLRADGKVTVRGTHIVSHATGPHRIKGGNVSIN